MKSNSLGNKLHVDKWRAATGALVTQNIRKKSVYVKNTTVSSLLVGQLWLLRLMSQFGAKQYLGWHNIGAHDVAAKD